MQDIGDVDTVEISIRYDGKVIWVNIDDVCVLRVSRLKRVVIDDRRIGR